MEIYKLTPATKNYIWGGSRLREDFGISADSENIAEAWVLSCHPDGRSRISGGEFDGKSLAGLLSRNHDYMGTHSKNFSRFPVMVKLIDAADDLSIQVHPDNEYAEEIEGDQGKCELWYVVDAEPGAQLIYGFAEDMTQDQFRQAIRDGSVVDYLDHYDVEKGDVFFIEPGTVHAIGKGILIAEIQQNSNITYRIHDYDRTDSEGNPRELHIEKAVDVGITVPSLRKPGPERLPRDIDGRSETLLASCEYFTSRLMEIEAATHFNVDDTSFAHLLVTDGKLKIQNGDDIITVNKGESVFIPAGFGKVNVSGRAEFIVTTI